MPRPDQNPADRTTAISAAHTAARRAAVNLARVLPVTRHERAVVIGCGRVRT